MEFLFKTIVTSNMADAIAEHYHVKLMEVLRDLNISDRKFWALRRITMEHICLVLKKATAV